MQAHSQLGRSSPGTTDHLDGKAIWAALKQSVLTNFGDTGWGAVGLSLTGEFSIIKSLYIYIYIEDEF